MVPVKPRYCVWYRFFFGERPGRLVPKSRVTDSFAKHYLPNESSYIIFEYQRHEQTCMALIYASPNEEGLCYRFVDKGFDKDDFIEARRDSSLYPVSCRGLCTRFLNRKIVIGMFMRSTDFADLREMLVNCFEESRESISLELQMETLDSWHNDRETREQKHMLKNYDLPMLDLDDAQGTLKTQQIVWLNRDQLEPTPTLYQYD